MHGVYDCLRYFRSTYGSNETREVCSDLSNEQDCTDYIVKASKKTVLFKSIIRSLFSRFFIWNIQSIIYLLCKSFSFLIPRGTPAFQHFHFVPGLNTTETAMCVLEILDGFWFKNKKHRVTKTSRISLG